MADRKSKRPVRVNWHFGEEDDDRVRLGSSQNPVPTGRGRSRIWAWVALLVVILAAGGIGALNISAQRAREAERLAIKTAIQERLDLEAWAWHNEDWETTASLLDPDARRDWARWHTQASEGLHHWAGPYAQRPRFQVAALTLLEANLAQVTVHVAQAEVPNRIPSQEVRTYRWVDDVWMRTAPIRSQWGDPTQIQTRYFVFDYFTRDTVGVDAVATGADSLYTNLRNRLGLAAPPLGQSLVVQIVPENFAANMNQFVGPKVVLLSPSLTRIPDGWSEAQALAATLAHPLSRYALDAAVAPDQIHPSWHVMFQGVQDWLAREINPLVDVNSARSWAALDLYITQNGPPSLESLHAGRNPNWTWASGWMTLAAESVVTYGLSTYGPEKVDDLVAGFVMYDSWEGLLPDVFGVSASEFEAGWHGWVMEGME